MTNFVRYVSHQITASNQHGIHSPFVYDYVTKCLYKRQPQHASKSFNVLLQSILYFQLKSVKFLSDEEKLQQKAQEKLEVTFRENPPYDLIYLENPSQKIKLKDEEVHNDTIIFLNNIHKNVNNENTWTQLKNNKKITVSIDLFYCGLLFFRKEQLKEHFKIRI